MKNARLKHAAMVGGFLAVLVVLCFLWKFLLTDPAAQQFHLTALKVAFPGFSGFTLGSVIWGLVLSFVYGFVASLIFHAFHKKCCIK